MKGLAVVVSGCLATFDVSHGRGAVDGCGNNGAKGGDTQGAAAGISIGDVGKKVSVVSAKATDFFLWRALETGTVASIPQEMPMVGET